MNSNWKSREPCKFWAKGTEELWAKARWESSKKSGEGTGSQLTVGTIMSSRQNRLSSSTIRKNFARSTGLVR